MGGRNQVGKAVGSGCVSRHQGCTTSTRLRAQRRVVAVVFMRLLGVLSFTLQASLTLLQSTTLTRLQAQSRLVVVVFVWLLGGLSCT